MSVFSEKFKTSSKKRFITPDEPLPKSYLSNIHVPRLVSQPYSLITIDASSTFTNKLLSSNSKILIFLGLYITGSNRPRLNFSAEIKIGSINNDSIKITPNEVYNFGDNIYDIFLTNPALLIGYEFRFLSFQTLTEYKKESELLFSELVTNEGYTGTVYNMVNQSLSENVRAIIVNSILSARNGLGFDQLLGDQANGLDVDVTRLPPIPVGDNLIGRVKITDDGTDIANVAGSATAPVDSNLGLWTVDRLFGWEVAGAQWRKIQIDSSGRLIVVPLGGSMSVNNFPTCPNAHRTTGAVGAAVTLTLTPVVDHINVEFLQIQMFNTANRIGTATPVDVTFGAFLDHNAVARTLTHRFPSSGAIGTVETMQMNFHPKILGQSATNVVISCPATPFVIWQINVHYSDDAVST